MNQNIVPTNGHVDILVDGKSETYIVEPLNNAFETLHFEAKDNASAKLHLLYNGNGEASNKIDITIGEGCDVTLSVSIINGAKVNIDMHVDIIGENSTFRAPGIMLPSDGQDFTYHANIYHKVGHSSTYQKVRTAANGNGKADFFGLVTVEHDAQKTETEQVNNNILLSRDARIESKPQLIIYADDVKCSHGSTTGMLDQEQIFYMRSRGISEKTAKGLLLQAFLKEVVDEIDNGDYAESLTEAISAKLSN